MPGRGNFYPRPPRGGRPTHKARHTHPDTISIHALREEGDCLDISTRRLRPISIHALREEGDSGAAWQQRNGCYFYPRPPRGGRPAQLKKRQTVREFLSTPSARRATVLCSTSCIFSRISIHALREEGDESRRAVFAVAGNFYPRPPRGGRLVCHVFDCPLGLFLSTPSARRATPRPRPAALSAKFLSTPSARRATVCAAKASALNDNFYPRPPRGGRPGALLFIKNLQNFYPRPPRGGRRGFCRGRRLGFQFLSTPSARRATAAVIVFLTQRVFLSTPSARRATRSAHRSFS